MNPSEIFSHHARRRNKAAVAYLSNELVKLTFSERFTNRASDYVAGRPSYPEECFTVLFQGLGNPAALTVVDLGAGTGISSRLLCARGASVIAVEPNRAMREHAEPGINLIWKAGTAEDTGLPIESADLVTAFQAFHWFDSDGALREIVRILRPSGRAAVIYNERDDNDPFTAAYSYLARCHSTGETEPQRNDGRAEFETYSGWSRVRVIEFENAQCLDRAGIHARARSTSYLPNDGAAGTQLHAAIDALFDRYDSDGMVKMLMKTIVTIGFIE